MQVKAQNLLQQHIKSILSLVPDSVRIPVGNQASLRRISNALLCLQRGLTGDRGLAGEGYMDKNDLLSAYLLYYWPVSYQQMRHILRQLPKDALLPSLHAEDRDFSILDIGSGPGPASAALCDFLIHKQFIKNRNISVCFTDHSTKATALAQALFARDFPAVKTESRRSDIEQGTILPPDIQAVKKYSAALFCHSLNEFWQNKEGRIEKRVAIIEQILDIYMEENALLILCEPAQTQSSRELIAVRDALLAARTDLQLLAPCVCANVPCPALLQGDGSTCHAEGNWEAVEPATSLAEAAGLDRQSIKMAYFAFRKGAAEESDSGDSARTPATAAGHSRETCLQDGTFTARIVSDAMLNKAGRVRFVLCDGKQRFSLSAKKGDAGAGAKGFWNLKRGKRITVRGAERRGEAEKPSLAMTDGTELTLLD